MQIERASLDAMGGEDQVRSRVTAFLAALEAHKTTIGVAAPAEDPLVEAIARAGGMDAVEVIEPEPAQPSPLPPTWPPTITALEFRRQFTAEERAAITLAAARGLAAGDATLQLWLDDLNASQSVDLTDPQISQALTAMVSMGLLDAARPDEILKAA